MRAEPDVLSAARPLDVAPRAPSRPPARSHAGREGLESAAHRQPIASLCLHGHGPVFCQPHPTRGNHASHAPGEAPERIQAEGTQKGFKRRMDASPSPLRLDVACPLLQNKPDRVCEGKTIKVVSASRFFICGWGYPLWGIRTVWPLILLPPRPLVPEITAQARTPALQYTGQIACTFRSGWDFMIAD